MEKPTQLTFGQAHTVRLDWRMPVKADGKGRRAWAERRKKLLRQQLGIASYGGLHSFLYVTNREVRHEILIPVLTLQQLLEVNQAKPRPEGSAKQRLDPGMLSVKDQLDLQTKAGKYFLTHNRIKINGRYTKCEVERCQVFGLDIADFALNRPARSVAAAQARLGIILRYPVPQATKLRMHWASFGPHAEYLRTLLLADYGKSQTFQLNKNQPELKWQYRGLLKATKLAQISGAAESRQKRRQVLETLLGNLYACFDYATDSAVYDGITKCVSAKMVRKTYLLIKKTLLVAEQGGSRSHVKQVKVITSVPTTTKRGFRIRAVWRVWGEVEHWGHVHSRENEYEAIVELVKFSDSWRIDSLNVISHRLVQAKTSIRSLEIDRDNGK